MSRTAGSKKGAQRRFVEFRSTDTRDRTRVFLPVLREVKGGFVTPEVFFLGIVGTNIPQRSSKTVRWDDETGLRLSETLDFGAVTYRVHRFYEHLPADSVAAGSILIGADAEEAALRERLRREVEERARAAREEENHE